MDEVSIEGHVDCSCVCSSIPSQTASAPHRRICGSNAAQLEDVLYGSTETAPSTTSLLTPPAQQRLLRPRASQLPPSRTAQTKATGTRSRGRPAQHSVTARALRRLLPPRVACAAQFREIGVAQTGRCHCDGRDGRAAAAAHEMNVLTEVKLSPLSG